jgi:hypothetical protein
VAVTPNEGEQKHFSLSFHIADLWLDVMRFFKQSAFSKKTTIFAEIEPIADFIFVCFFCVFLIEPIETLCFF